MQNVCIMLSPLENCIGFPVNKSTFFRLEWLVRTLPNTFSSLVFLKKK